MTWKTHKRYSVTGALVASMIIYKLGLTSISYYIALMIILPVAKYGALFPDLDHAWRNVHDKTVPNWIINKIIHETGGKHRSWQTHSIDIAVIAGFIGYMMPKVLWQRGIIDIVNEEVISILIMGFMAGWLSHLFADMMTSEGVRLVWFSKRKVSFVPKKIGEFRFNTGNEWESFNYKVLRWMNMIVGVICLAYPLINTKIISCITMGGN